MKSKTLHSFFRLLTLVLLVFVPSIAHAALVQLPYPYTGTVQGVSRTCTWDTTDTSHTVRCLITSGPAQGQTQTFTDPQVAQYAGSGTNPGTGSSVPNMRGGGTLGGPNNDVPGGGGTGEGSVNKAIGSFWDKMLGSVKDFVGKFFLGTVAWIGALISWMIVWVLTPLVWLMGQIFEFVIQNFVLRMGNWINDAQAEGVRAAWKIMRDIANIGIIAGLVATAIGTIIGNENYSINKSLAKLLIAALLVNFSYFFAGVAIDAANFTTKALYSELIQGQSCPFNRYLTVGIHDKCTISDRFIDIMRLKNLGKLTARAEAVDEAQAFTTQAVTVLFHNLMTIVFMFFIIGTLAAATGLLVARFVVLILLLVTSPIGIAGGMVPILKDYAKSWREALLNQAFFAPAYILLVGISLRIAEQSKGAIEQAGLNVSGDPHASAATAAAATVVTYIIAIAFMEASRRVAKKMADKAGEFSDVYKAIGDRVTKAVQFVPAAYLRNTVGRASDALLVQHNNRLAPLLSQLGPLGKMTDRGIADALEAGKKLKPYGGKSFTEVKDTRKARDIEVSKRTKEMSKRAEADKASADIKKAQAEYDEIFSYENREQRKNANGELLYWEHDAKGNRTGKTTAVDNGDKAMETMQDLQRRLEKTTGLMDAKIKLRAALADLPGGTVERWFDEEPELLERYADALSEEQFLGAMSSDKIPISLKKKMRQKRFGEYIELVDGLQDDVDSGRVIEGGEEYNDRISHIFNYAKETLRSPKEFLDLIVSETGRHLREKRVLWHGSTNGMYREAQQSDKLSEEEKYHRIRPLKQKTYIQHMHGWSGAEIIKGRGDELPYVPADNMDERAETMAWADATIAHSDSVLNNSNSSKSDREKAGRLKRFAKLVKEKANYDNLSAEDQAFVDEMQEQFTSSMIGWYPGKAPGEVQSEMLDRALYHPLAARGITTAQLGALEQDERFMEALRNNILIGGDPEVIRQIKNNPQLEEKYGWPDAKKLEEIEVARKEFARRNGLRYYTLEEILQGKEKGGGGEGKSGPGERKEDAQPEDPTKLPKL